MGTNYYLRLKGCYRSEKFKNFPEPGNSELVVQELKNGYVWNDMYYPDVTTLNNKYYLSLHIGKCSLGWNFGLHTYPIAGINSLEDWEKLFALPNAAIHDECGDELSVELMMNIITNRSALDWKKYASQEEYEAGVVQQWNSRFSELHDQIYSYPKSLKSYDDYLALRDFGTNGAVRGARGLLGRKPEQHYEVIHVDGASYDIIPAEDNYGW